MMTSAEFIAWAEQQDKAGQKDGMGYPWTSWQLAVRSADGTLKRDQRGHQIFETFAAHKARHCTVPVGQNLELFA